jgi:hypothetical protein
VCPGKAEKERSSFGGVTRETRVDFTADRRRSGFFILKKAASFYSINDYSEHTVVLITSGITLNQQDPGSCSEDLAST